MDQKFEKTKKEIGYVVSTQDYLMNIQGLPSARVNDIIMTREGGRALVSALVRDKVEAVMLDPERPKPGDFLEKAEKGLSIPIGNILFGRAINPLGVAIDNKTALPPGTESLDLDIVAPGIDGREKIRRQFYTGITMVDTLLPIGRGQRELIMCEPRSGKEQFFLDIILAQKSTGVICIYAGVGRNEVEIKRFAEDINKYGASEYTVIVAGTSKESAPLITVTPLVAASLSEYYRNQGKDVLLIIDDLATHAKYAREIGLLAGRVPGRESYPADIFYQHSSMLERGGSFNEHHKNGAITLLPVIETNIENFTNLIPTNVMSITDGHILFSAALRAQGKYPAIEPDRSVTRVGRQTQTMIHKRLSDKVRLLLAEFHELERFARFGSELSKETQVKIKRGKMAEELIQQEVMQSIHPNVQILYLGLVFAGFFDNKEAEKVRASKSKILEALLKNSPYKEYAEGVMKIENLDEVTNWLKENMGGLEASYGTNGK